MHLFNIKRKNIKRKEQIIKIENKTVNWNIKYIILLNGNMDSCFQPKWSYRDHVYFPAWNKKWSKFMKQWIVRYWILNKGQETKKWVLWLLQLIVYDFVSLFPALHSMQDLKFLNQGLNPHPLQWKHAVLTTGLPENPYSLFLERLSSFWPGKQNLADSRAESEGTKMK